MSVYDEVEQLISMVMDLDDWPIPVIRFGPAVADVFMDHFGPDPSRPEPDRLCGIPVHSDPTLPIGGWKIIHGDTIRTGNVFGENPPTLPGRIVRDMASGDIYWKPDATLVHYMPPPLIDPAKLRIIDRIPDYIRDVHPGERRGDATPGRV